MFESFTSKLNETIETAKNDLKQNLSKKFTVAATNLSTIGAGGGKTKLLWKVLEHSKASCTRLESKINHIKVAEGNHDGITTGSAVTSQVEVSIVSGLLLDFKYLIEAFDLMYVERTYLEEILVAEGELESLDDLELVAQYYKELHASLGVSKNEVHRLVTKLAEMTDQNEVIQARNDHGTSIASLSSTNVSSASELEKRVISLELSLKQTGLLLEGLKAEKVAFTKQVQEMTDELAFLKEKNQEKTRSQSLPIIQTNNQKESFIPDHNAEYVKSLEQELIECKRELRRRSSLETPKVSSTPNSTSSNCSENTLRSVIEETERLKLENHRLKNNNTSEYNRNLVLKFLQKPEQRSDMVELLAKAFNLNERDLKNIKL